MRAGIAITILTLALAACQSSPPPARLVSIETAPRVKVSVADKANVTYMAQYLLPGRLQSSSVVYKGLGGEPSLGLSAMASNTIGVGAAGAAGQSPISRGGAPKAIYAGEGIDIISAFAGSKSPANVVGRVYLPDHVNGQALASVEQAREFIRQDVRRRVDQYAALTGRTVSCFDLCSGFYPTYRLTKTGGGQAWPFYDPADLYATFFIHKPNDMRMSQNAVLDTVLTFHDVWEGGFFIALNSVPPAGGHHTDDGESVPDFQDTSAFAHPIERTLLRVLTEGGNYAVGSQDWRQFAWNGRVFGLGKKLDLDSLIEYEIAPVTDSPRGSA